MSIKRILMILIILCAFHLPADAGGPFELSIVVMRGGQYVEPFGKKITIYQQPTPFSVRLTNVSSSSQEIHKVANASVLQGVQFEIKAPGSSKKILRMKREHLSSRMVISRYIKPGDSRVANIVIDPETWENVFILEPGVKYKVRAVYLDDNKKIYSDYYTVVLEE